MIIHSIFNHARENGYAIGAFNVGNLETLKAVVQAGIAKNSPVIIEASQSEVSYWGVGQLRAVVDAFIVETGLPILLNLDHASDFDQIQEAIAVGYDLIHVDASKMPLEENITLTAQVVKLSHEVGAICEGEMDHIQGSSDDHRDEDVGALEDEAFYTNPEKAVEYINKTGIDTFAAFFGNVHGVFNRPPTLDFDRLKRISDITDAFLSMHGGSGIADQDVRKAIEIGGIVKVNVNSEMRIGFREALVTALQADPTIKPYEFYEPAIAEVQAIVEQKMDVFGSTGRADDIAVFLKGENDG